jgi:hypothetical protein
VACAEDGTTGFLAMVEMTVQPQLTMVAICRGNGVSKAMRVKRYQSGVVVLIMQSHMALLPMPGMRLHC